MKNERILAYTKATRIAVSELSNVVAAGTTVATSQATYDSHTGCDVVVDATVDF